MSQRVAAGVVIVIALVYVAFMARVLIDDAFRPPAEVGMLGPALLTLVGGFLVVKRKADG